MTDEGPLTVEIVNMEERTENRTFMISLLPADKLSSGERDHDHGGFVPVFFLIHSVFSESRLSCLRFLPPLVSNSHTHPTLSDEGKVLYCVRTAISCMMLGACNKQKVNMTFNYNPHC